MIMMIIIIIVLENGSESYVDAINLFFPFLFFFLQKVLTNLSYLASQSPGIRSSKIKWWGEAREMGCLPAGWAPTEENSKSGPNVTCTWCFQLGADTHHLSAS